MPGIGDLWSRVDQALSGDDDAMQDVAQTVGRFARLAVDPVEQAFAEKLLRWLSHAQQRAVAKWHHPQVMIQCDVMGTRARCSNRSTGRCACCGRNVCLPHAMISADADMLCAHCFQVARQHAPRWQGPPDDFMHGRPGADEPRAQDGPKEAQHPPVTPQELLRAYVTLGADPDISDEALERLVRDARVKNHPDRYKSTQAKRNAETRFKEIGLAYDLVQRARKAA